MPRAWVSGFTSQARLHRPMAGPLMSAPMRPKRGLSSRCRSNGLVRPGCALSSGSFQQYVPGSSGLMRIWYPAHAHGRDLSAHPLPVSAGPEGAQGNARRNCLIQASSVRQSDRNRIETVVLNHRAHRPVARFVLRLQPMHILRGLYASGRPILRGTELLAATIRWLAYPPANSGV